MTHMKITFFWIGEDRFLLKQTIRLFNIAERAFLPPDGGLRFHSEPITPKKQRKIACGFSHTPLNIRCRNDCFFDLFETCAALIYRTICGKS